jgi:hypothetical protein
MKQTLFKNLFNSMDFLRIFLFVISDKIFHGRPDRGTSGYRKINFLTTSALSGLRYLAV